MASAGAVAAVAAGAPIFFVSPDTRVFALCFTPMLTVLVWLVLGPWRSSMMPAARAARWAMIAVLAAVACCLVLALYGVARYPGAGRDPWHLTALVFAVLLIGYLWIAVAGLGASGSTTSAQRPAGLVAGMVLGGLWAAGNVTNDPWLSIALLVPAGAVVVLGARLRSVDASPIVGR